MDGIRMTKEEWLENNPQVTRAELLDDLITWRIKAIAYQSQLSKEQQDKAERRFKVKKDGN